MKRIRLVAFVAALGSFASGAIAFTISPQSDILVAGEDANFVGHIFRYQRTGPFIGKFEYGGPQLDGPIALRHGPDGNLYVLHGGDSVEKYNGSTGFWMQTFISGQFTEAKDMLFDPRTGNLLVAANDARSDSVASTKGTATFSSCGEGEGGRVAAFSAVGRFLGDVVPCLSGGSGLNRLSEAMSLAFSPDGTTLYVGNDASALNFDSLSAAPQVSSRPYNVLRFRISYGRGTPPYASQYTGTVLSSDSHYLYDPNNMVVAGDGNLYVAWEDCRYVFAGETCAGAITRVTPIGFPIDIVPGWFAGQIGFSEASGLRVSITEGKIYVGSGDTAQVFVFNLLPPMIGWYKFDTLSDVKGISSAAPFDFP